MVKNTFEMLVRYKLKPHYKKLEKIEDQLEFFSNAKYQIKEKEAKTIKLMLKNKNIKNSASKELIKAYEDKLENLDDLLERKEIIKLASTNIVMFFKTGKQFLNEKGINGLQKINNAIDACKNEIKDFEKNELIQKYVNNKKIDYLKQQVTSLKAHINNRQPSYEFLTKQKAKCTSKITKLTALITPKQQEAEIEL